MDLIRSEHSAEFRFDIFKEDSFGTFGFLVHREAGTIVPVCFGEENSFYFIADLYALFFKLDGEEQINFLTYWSFTILI